MFATLLARLPFPSLAITLVWPILALLVVGPAALQAVDSLSAETLYCGGMSTLLVLMGACALLALPRSDDDVRAVMGTLRVIGQRAGDLGQAPGPVQAAGLLLRRLPSL